MKEWIVVIDLNEKLRRWSVWHDRIDGVVQPMSLDTLEGCIERLKRGLPKYPKEQNRYFIIKWDTCEIIPCVALGL